MFSEKTVITLKQIQTLDAVVREGSFQAGARALHRTHPSVITLLKKLEQQLGFALFDRSAYRTTLTAAGGAFHRESRRLLEDHDALAELADYLRQGRETRLSLIIGDVTPLEETLRILRGFADCHPWLQLDLGFENLAGPRERLLDGEADLIVHYVDPADPRFEYQPLTHVEIIPVAAPDFLDFAVSPDIDLETMRRYPQCIIRDTARHSEKDNYFVLQGAPRVTVGDQHTKKAVILRGMAWGHMPLFLIADELADGRLVSLAGRHVKGTGVDIVAARLAGGRKGEMAAGLWNCFRDAAGVFSG